MSLAATSCQRWRSTAERTDRHENITLVGVIEARGGCFDPTGDDAEVNQSDIVAPLREQREAADAFHVGRVTFEHMRRYGPQQADDMPGITH